MNARYDSFLFQFMRRVSFRKISSVQFEEPRNIKRYPTYE